MTAGKQEPDSDVKPPSASKSLSVVRKGIFIYFEHYFCEDIRKFYTFFLPIRIHNIYGNMLTDCFTKDK